MKYKCLTIAGFDGSGGAGIQADLKTFSALGCYGMTVLTALPIQNTCGVSNCYEVPIQAVQEQLEAIFNDIRPDCIKIGMLFSSQIIELVAKFLSNHAQSIPIVVDPVMLAKSGDSLLQPDAIQIMKRSLIPLAMIITPNLPEAKALASHVKEDPLELAKILLEYNPKAVLIKGGHGTGSTSDDVFLDQSGKHVCLRKKRLHTKNTHGTGCTLSAAICAFLAREHSLLDSCKYAKEYLFEAMKAAQNQTIGKGAGPVDHFYFLNILTKETLNNEPFSASLGNV